MAGVKYYAETNMITASRDEMRKALTSLTGASKKRAARLNYLPGDLSKGKLSAATRGLSDAEVAGKVVRAQNTYNRLVRYKKIENAIVSEFRKKNGREPTTDEFFKILHEMSQRQQAIQGSEEEYLSSVSDVIDDLGYGGDSVAVNAANALNGMKEYI